MICINTKNFDFNNIFVKSGQSWTIIRTYCYHGTFYFDIKRGEIKLHLTRDMYVTNFRTY